MDKTTHQIRHEQWSQIIQECLTSGMSKTAWCKAHGISIKAFFYWQRILRNEAYIEQKQVPAAGESKPDLPVAFVELKPASSEKTCFQPDMIIRSRGIVVELSNTVSPELLRQIGGILHAE